MFNSVSHEFLGQFLLICIGFVVLYIQQRIKNRATKDDIKKLTSITESVKKEFTDKTEALKSQLNLVTQHTLSLKKAEMDAIFNLNKTYTGYMLHLINFNFHDYLLPDNKELNIIHAGLKDKHHEIIIQHAHISLFIRSDDFKIAHDRFKSLLIKYAAETGDCVMKLIVLYDIKYIEAKKLNTDEERKQHAIAMHKKMQEEIKLAESKRDALADELLLTHYNLIDCLQERLSKILR